MSPILGGVLAFTLFFLLRLIVLRHDNAYQRAFFVLPIVGKLSWQAPKQGAEVGVLRVCCCAFAVYHCALPPCCCRPFRPAFRPQSSSPSSSSQSSSSREGEALAGRLQLLV